MPWVMLATGLGALVVSSDIEIDGASHESASRIRHPLVSAVPFPTESLSQAVVRRDLFRSSRRPASVSYDPLQALAPTAADAPPKPPLALVGIVAGVAPTAVIEGFPGIEGPRVVHQGDLVAGLLVQRITRAAVRVVGMDTVWLLGVREPWK